MARRHPARNVELIPDNSTRDGTVGLSEPTAGKALFTFPLLARLASAVPGPEGDNLYHVRSMWWIKRALLDLRVANRLGEIGVNAPVYGDEFLRGGFEYMVFDPDETVRVNYCELVLANRVTARWWPKLA